VHFIITARYRSPFSAADMHRSTSLTTQYLLHQSYHYHKPATLAILETDLFSRFLVSLAFLLAGGRRSQLLVSTGPHAAPVGFWAFTQIQAAYLSVPTCDIHA
jgi:hypothetical protein